MTTVTTLTHEVKSPEEELDPEEHRTGQECISS